VAYATYGYNALQQLTTRSSTAVGAPIGQVAYIYDLEGHLIAEATASSGATTRDYIWAASNDNTPVDLPLAVAEAATLYMVHTDHLGLPIRMTDAAKSTVWQALYKPWGEVQTTSGSITNNLRFPGQLFQIETSYAYNWHRHYDPITGRYTQPDPLRFVDGPSMYAYVKNTPLLKTDRNGLAIDPKSFATPAPEFPHSAMPHGKVPNGTGQYCSSSQDCRDKCTPILERPLRFPGSDKNTWDYHKCYNKCMELLGN
jgi:RHS repeat-associated protein